MLWFTPCPLLLFDVTWYLEWLPTALLVHESIGWYFFKQENPYCSTGKNPTSPSSIHVFCMINKELPRYKIIYDSSAQKIFKNIKFMDVIIYCLIFGYAILVCYLLGYCYLCFFVHNVGLGREGVCLVMLCWYFRYNVRYFVLPFYALHVLFYAALDLLFMQKIK